MKYSSTLLFLLLAAFANGQVLFNKTYFNPDYDYGIAVIERFDGNYLIAGSSRSQSGTDYDVYLILADANGALIWDKYIGQTARAEFAHSLLETTDNQYVVAGRIGISNPYLIKFDASGDLVWEKTYETPLWDEAFSVGRTYTNGYYFISTGAQTRLFVTNAQGDTLWTKPFEGLNSQSVIQTADSGFAMTGYFHPDSTNQDIFILKTAANGDTLWSKQFGGAGTDFGTSILQLADHGFLAAGGVDPQLIHGNHETYLIRTNAHGDTLWTKRHFLGNPTHIQACRNNSGFILSSRERQGSSFPNPDVYWLTITKLDTLGNIGWTRTFDGSAAGYGNNVIQTSDGGFLLTGFRFNQALIPDIVLIKLDSVGNFVLSTAEAQKVRKARLLAYPNPATTELNFDLQSEDGESIAQIAVYNAFGQAIKMITAPTTARLQLNLQDFAPGLYYYKLLSNKQQSWTGKFVVGS